MKCLTAAALAVLISTAAIASTTQGQTTPVGTAGEGYIYGGFGPNNDSR